MFELQINDCYTLAQETRKNGGQSLLPWNPRFYHNPDVLLWCNMYGTEVTQPKDYDIVLLTGFNQLCLSTYIEDHLIYYHDKPTRSPFAKLARYVHSIWRYQP